MPTETSSVYVFVVHDKYSNTNWAKTKHQLHIKKIEKYVSKKTFIVSFPVPNNCLGR